MNERNRVGAVALRSGLFLALGYAIACALAHYQSLAAMFLEFPPTYQRGSDFVELRSDDGTRIMARHWPNASAKFTLLYFHGNGEDLGVLSAYIDHFHAAGFAVFSIDYRGYGHSEGKPSEATTYADARAAYRYLRERLGVPAERIIVWGYSLGGGAATEIAATEEVAGLVLESAFTSAYRVVTRVPVLAGDKFNNVRKLARVKSPVLVLHGTDDEAIPLWHGQALFAAAREPKRKLFVEGGGHGGLEAVARADYWRTLREFTAGLITAPPTPAP